MSLFFYNTPVFFLTILLVVLLIVFVKQTFAQKSGCLTLFFLGIVYPILYFHFVYSFNLSQLELAEPQHVSGEIIAVKTYEYSHRLQLSPTHIGNKKIKPWQRVKLEIYLAKKLLINNKLQFEKHDFVSLKLRLKSISTRLNPGLFDKRLYHFFNGVKYRGTIRQIHDIKHVKHISLASKVHTNSQLYWLYQGILFGDKSLMPNTFSEQARKLGISHLFAVSGLHMGIVFLLAMALGRLLCLIKLSNDTLKVQQDKLVMLLVVSLCFGYLHLVDYATSATRAFMMVLAYCLCRLNNRTIVNFRSLLLALVFVLIVNPFSPVTSGFYFSFIAVTSIFIALLLVTKFNIQSSVLKLLFIQICVSISLIPSTLFFFGSTSIIGVLVNMIAIPIFTFLIMPVILINYSLLAIFGVNIFTSLTERFLLYLVDSIITLGAQVASFDASIDSIALCLFLTIGFWLVVYIKQFVFIFLPICLILLVPMFKKDRLIVHVLDVGHGLAVLVVKNNKALLYDTGARYGNYTHFDSIINPILKRERLDLIATIVSHDDMDHIGGLKSIITSGKGHTIKANGALCNIRPNLIDALTITSYQLPFLYPTDNNNSCVVSIKYNGFHLLLTGDIETQRERQLITEYDFGPVDVMTSPHHGSNTSSSALFISEINPTWVVHSINTHNRWQLPKNEITQRYSNFGIKQTGTYFGAITIEVFDDQYIVRNQKQLKRYWFVR